MKKLVYYLVFIAILGLTACKKTDTIPKPTNQTMRVNVVTVGENNIDPTLRLTGTVVAREDVAVGTALAGQKIVAVMAEVGQRVQKGQVLAQLDSVNVQSQLKQNEMALDKAKANLTARQAELQEAKTTLARYQQLIGDNAVSQQELEQQRLRVQTAQANIDTAQADITQIQSQILESRHQRDKANIIAPASGVISQRQAEAGALAGNEALFHLIKDGEKELSANANAEELAQLRVGMPANVYIRGQDTALAGKIRIISPQMDSNTRLGKVLIAFEHNQNLPNGAYGEVTIQLPPRTMTMAVPNQAVSFLDNGQAFVMTVDNKNTIKRQMVQIGQQYTGQTEIVSGIQAGTRVVKNAAAFVNDGDIITPVLDNTNTNTNTANNVKPKE